MSESITTFDPNAGLMAGFEAVVARAAALQAQRESASKAAGTSYLDALNKSTDSQVVDIRAEIDSHVKALNGWTETRDDGTKTEHLGLRDAAKARLVEIDELSGEAAALDKIREDFSQARSQVRAMFDAFVKAGVFTDPALLAKVESLARPILGQDRGRPKSE